MNKRIYLLFALIFLVLLTAIFLHRKSLTELDNSMEWVNHTYEVIGSLNEVSGDLKSAELHMQDFTNNPDNRLVSNDFVDMITDLGKVRPLIADDLQEQRIDSISAIINIWRTMIAGNNPEKLNDPDFHEKVKSIILQIQGAINRCVLHQRDLLNQRQTILKAIVTSLHRWTIILIVLAFLLVIFTSFYGYKQLKNRIDLEVLLESILNASQEGIITCKTCREGFKVEDFEILFANNAVKTHLGLESSDLIGKSIFYIMPEIQTSGLLAKWIQVVEDGLPDEYEACHKDTVTNKENWYSIKLVKLGDGVTVTFHNITELRSYQQNLNIS